MMLLLSRLDGTFSWVIGKYCHLRKGRDIVSEKKNKFYPTCIEQQVNECHLRDQKWIRNELFSEGLKIQANKCSIGKNRINAKKRDIACFLCIRQEEINFRLEEPGNEIQEL